MCKMADPARWLALLLLAFSFTAFAYSLQLRQQDWSAATAPAACCLAP